MYSSYPLVFICFTFMASFSSFISPLFAKKEPQSDHQVSQERKVTTEQKKGNRATKPSVSSKDLSVQSKRGQKEGQKHIQPAHQTQQEKVGFQKGLFSLQGDINYQHQIINETFDAQKVAQNSRFLSSFSFTPRFGYFLVDDFELALKIRFQLDSLIDEQERDLSSLNSVEFTLNPTYYLSLEPLSDLGLYPLFHTGIGYKQISNQNFISGADPSLTPEGTRFGLVLLGGTGVSWVKGKPSAGRFILSLLLNYEYDSLNLEYGQKQGEDWSFFQTHLTIGMLF